MEDDVCSLSLFAYKGYTQFTQPWKERREPDDGIVLCFQPLFGLLSSVPKWNLIRALLGPVLRPVKRTVLRRIGNEAASIPNDLIHLYTCLNVFTFFVGSVSHTESNNSCVFLFDCLLFFVNFAGQPGLAGTRNRQPQHGRPYAAHV